MIKLPIEIGDILLVGRFKNKRIKVKEIGTDEHGLPTVNGRSILKIRIEKLMEPKKNLKEGTMSLKDLENYFYENESDIRDNMKIYGFKLKDISKIRNYMDLASVLGADSNDVKDVDLRQYTDTLADLLKNEQQESKQFSLAQAAKKILKESMYDEDIIIQFDTIDEYSKALELFNLNKIKFDRAGYRKINLLGDNENADKAIKILEDNDIDFEESEPESIEGEVEEGDYVDFGGYGKLYVVKLRAGLGDRNKWWVTDQAEDRFNPDARGWYIDPSSAKKILEKGNTSDED